MLDNRIQNMIRALKNADQRNQIIVTSLVGQYLKHKPPNIPVDPSYYRDVAASLKERDDFYARMQSEIKSLRGDIQVAIMTPQLSAEDNTHFDKINATASTPTVFSEGTWAPAGSWKFAEVRQYFEELDKRLGYTHPGNNF